MQAAVASLFLAQPASSCRQSQGSAQCQGEERPQVEKPGWQGCVCFVRMVQTGSKADGTFSSDVSGGGDTCEDGIGGLMRGVTLVRRHLACQGNDVTEKLTKCKQGVHWRRKGLWAWMLLWGCMTSKFLFLSMVSVISTEGTCLGMAFWNPVLKWSLSIADHICSYKS